MIDAPFVERRNPPASIEQIPGFTLFKEWLQEQFKDVRGDVVDLKQAVRSLSKCLNEGNGTPSLREQTNLNTAFREKCEDEKADNVKLRKSAMWTLVVALILLVINIGLTVAGMRPG